MSRYSTCIDENRDLDLARALVDPACRTSGVLLASFRVECEAAVKALKPIPYPEAAEIPSLSRHSGVPCSVARPPV